MKRIAIPMIGAVVTSVVMELVVFPALYYLWRNGNFCATAKPARDNYEERLGEPSSIRISTIMFMTGSG